MSASYIIALFSTLLIKNYKSPPIEIRVCNKSAAETFGTNSQFKIFGTQDSELSFQFEQLGWYYNLFPCDISLYYDWPFFLLYNFQKCYFKGEPRSCFSNGRLVLNTHPKPWLIDFSGNGFTIAVGTDTAGRKSTDFNTTTKYTENDPLIINYNDGKSPVQYGTLNIFYDNEKMVIVLEDVAYYGYPRTCGKGE
eukprot:154638_1